MTITDEKRREVARRLRENAEYVSKHDDIDCVLNGILRGEEKQKGINEDCTACRRATLAELADLIEPSGHECVPGECPINVRHDNDRIDRDALLTLADEMEEFGSLPAKHPGARVLHSEDFSRELGYARRIREALGVDE